MKISIPSDKGFVQVNKGETQGSVWSSWNLDLVSNSPRAKISPRTKKITTSTDVATLIYPVAFVRTTASGNDQWWGVCNQAMVRSNASTDPTTAWIADNIANSPTTALDSLYSDAVDFNGTLIVSLKTNLASLGGGVWSQTYFSGLAGTNLVGSTPHPLCLGFTNELLIGDGNRVVSITPPATVDTARITLPREYQVVWIRSSTSNYWIGARNIYNRQAKVFQWDGASETYVGDFKVGSPEVYAGVVKDDVLYVINGNGQLLGFNGGGFQEVARLPVADHKYYTWYVNQTYPPVNRNGMNLIENKIHILLNAGLNSNLNELENMRSGIWQYTPETGLVHRYSLTNTLSSQFDFGSPIIANAGALVETDKLYGSLLAGFVNLTDQTTQISVIANLDIYSSGNVTDNISKVGYFVTPNLQTSEVEDMWQNAWLDYTKNLNSTDSIVLKYRTQKKNYTNPFKKAASWTSDTTFTSQTSQTWSDVSVGDEVEFLAGVGAGLQAQITAISTVGSTVTVTIDQTVTGTNLENMYVRVGNWTKIDTVSDQVTMNKQFAIGQNSNWVQFKVVMFGKGESPEIQKLTVASQPQLKAI